MKALVGVSLVATTLIGSVASAAITSTLKLGSRGAQVKELQQFLNACSSDTKVAATGAGSAGYETTYFGPATKRAVMAFQTKMGVSSIGLVGPATRAAITAGCGTNNNNNNNNNQSGPVTVSLSSDNPAAGTIIAGQATADLMHVTFTGSGTVNSVTLSRGGISDSSTLTNVYLYDGVNRLTDGYSFNTLGTLTMNNLNLAVNGSKTIAVKADVYSITNSYSISTTLSSFSAGTTTNTVSLKGNDMYIAGGSTLASIALSGANALASTTANVNAGSTSYAVWRQAFQVSTRALNLKSANFRISGSAPVDATANVGMYIDGVKAGNNATMTYRNGSNYLTFDMSSMPYSLTTGTHTVEIRTDIVKGSSFSFTVSLQSASDMMVVDPQVGVNLVVGSFVASSGTTVTVGTGSFTASNDPAFSALTTTTAAASNATIAKFKIHGYGEDVKVTSLPVTPVIGGSPSPAAAGLQNVSVYFNGSQIGSSTSWTSGAITLSPGSQMIIPAGVDSVLEIKADLRTTGGTNYTAGNISANLGAATAEGWYSKASITGPTATGTVLAMQTGTLALSANSGYASQNLNPNTAKAKIGSFVLQNQGSAESIRISTLAVKLAYGAGTSSANLGGLYTSETSGNAGTPVQPATAAASSNATNTFSTDFVLAPGAVKTIDIYADSGSDTGATATVISSLTVTSMGEISKVAATSSLTAGQTMAFRTGTVATPTLVGASSTAAQLIAAANGGVADGSKATYNFTSSLASSTISELTFTVSGATTATSLKIGTATASVISGTAYFTGLSIPVSTGGSGTNVDVYVSYPEVGSNGQTSGTTSAITLTTVKYSSGNSTATLSSLTVAAPTMTLVGSKPTVAVSTANVTGLNMGGENKIGEVTVTADAKGSIKINDIKLNVSNVGFTTNPTFTLARIADGTTTITGSSCGQGVAAAATQTIFCEFGTTGNTFTTTTGVANVEANDDFDGYTIAAGTSKTFSVYATVSAANTGTNLASINTSLVAAGFNWDDTASAIFVADGTTASPASGTNLTGSSIYNFPTGSYKISQ